MKIAEEELEKVRGKRIEKIHLSVGKLSGIVVESLRFALDASGQNGPLLNSEITIDEVPAKMKCLDCGHEFEADDFYTICPKCDAFKLEALTGKEMIIKSITITT